MQYLLLTTTQYLSRTIDVLLSIPTISYYSFSLVFVFHVVVYLYILFPCISLFRCSNLFVFSVKSCASYLSPIMPLLIHLVHVCVRVFTFHDLRIYYATCDLLLIIASTHYLLLFITYRFICCLLLLTNYYFLSCADYLASVIYCQAHIYDFTH